MAIQCKFIERPRTFEHGSDILEKALFPLINEYWEKEGRNIYKCDLAFNITAFINLWVTNGLVLLLAYEGDKPVGFLIGIKFTPMLYQRTVMQIETVYGQTDDARNALVAYLDQIQPVLSLDELWQTEPVKPVTLSGFKRRWEIPLTCDLRG